MSDLAAVKAATRARVVTATARCPVHHTPVARCPEPELSDVLDTLRDLAIDPVLVDADTMLLDQCGGCDDRPLRDGWMPETAVARISYLPAGGVATLREDGCPLCLPEMVAWHRRRRVSQLQVWLPVRTSLGVVA